MRFRQEVERNWTFRAGEHGERPGFGNAGKAGRERHAVSRCGPSALQGQQRATAPGIAVECRVGRGGEAGRQILGGEPRGNRCWHGLWRYRLRYRAAGCTRLGGEAGKAFAIRPGRARSLLPQG